MKVKEILANTLKEFGPIAFCIYKGSKETYLTFNYEDERGVGYADDRPEYERNYIQVHFFTPYSAYKDVIKKSIKAALSRISSVTKTFTTKEEETNLMHIVFSIELDIAEDGDGEI